MNTNHVRKMQPVEPNTYAGLPPPPPDESYWAALLNDDTPGESSPDETRVDEATWAAPAQSTHSAHQPLRPAPYDDADWDRAEQVWRDDHAVELLAVGYNRGGLLVEWNGLRGFVPASQLIDAPALMDARNSHLQSRVNQPMLLRIIELDREQNRLILSERAAQVQPGTRADVLDHLTPGATVTGRVTNLCDFGAFIDLGGLEGLIHISELSWGRVSHPRDILRRDQEVRVYVMDVYRDQGRIALSLKRLLADPWLTVEQRYQAGQIIEGAVTNIVDFGAFVCVEEGLEGLIHVSELAEGQFLHPRNVVQEGDRVRARILNIDGRGRRLGLSLREG